MGWLSLLFVAPPKGRGELNRQHARSAWLGLVSTWWVETTAKISKFQRKVTELALASALAL